MESRASESDPTPPGSFRLEELELFQRFENQILAGVNYYRWLQTTGAGETAGDFLFYVELLFENGPALLLTGGEDSTAIRPGSAEALVKTARELQALHGQSVIERLQASDSALWRPALGRRLEALRLSKNEAGLYANDALLLDFGEQRILVRLNPRGGLVLARYGQE